LEARLGAQSKIVSPGGTFAELLRHERRRRPHRAGEARERSRRRRSADARRSGGMVTGPTGGPTRVGHVSQPNGSASLSPRWSPTGWHRESARPVLLAEPDV